MIPTLLVFLVGVMVGVVSITVALAMTERRRGDDMREWQTDVTWEEHA